MANKAAARRFMRPLIITDLSDSVQTMIRQRARRKNISYEKAVAEFLNDAYSTEHDASIVNAWFEQAGEDDAACTHAECCRQRRVDKTRDAPF